MRYAHIFHLKNQVQTRQLTSAQIWCECQVVDWFRGGAILRLDLEPSPAGFVVLEDKDLGSGWGARRITFESGGLFRLRLNPLVVSCT